MAISTYDELKAALANWSFNRTDLPTANLIVLAEARITRDLRLREMDSDEALIGVVDEREIALPAGFMAPIEMFREDSTGRFKLTKLMPDMETYATAGQPIFWAIAGDKVVFERPCDTAYEFSLRCTKRVLALSDAAPTNRLLTYNPDLYLAACMVEAALWEDNTDKAATWNERYGAALEPLQAQEAKSREAPLRTEINDVLWGNENMRATGDGIGSGGDVLGA